MTPSIIMLITLPKLPVGIATADITIPTIESTTAAVHAHPLPLKRPYDIARPAIPSTSMNAPDPVATPPSIAADMPAGRFWLGTVVEIKGPTAIALMPAIIITTPAMAIRTAIIVTPVGRPIAYYH